MPLLLDLFCGAGGAAKGYRYAGWEVVGVDIVRQPRFPYEFLQRDVMEPGLLPHLVDTYRPHVIHASPPCQAYSPLNNINRKSYPDLIAPVRDMLCATGIPWIIENVPQAPLIDPVILCGSMFGLRLYRHRGFESNIRLVGRKHPNHVARCSRNGSLPTVDKPFMTITGGRHSRAWQLKACEYMGLPWLAATNPKELPQAIREVCEAIPPCFTWWVGKQLIEAIDVPPMDLGWLSFASSA
jgi:DNA (cytosine-5)-methyltransferase 1